MADVGDDLLDGDLEETAFGDLDGEEEDALLADDDYETYQNTRRTMFSDSTESRERHADMFHIVDQVQDVSEGDEIIEDGDVLELAVVDELDESELENGQLNNQAWAESSSRTVDTVSDISRRESSLGVTSSTSNIGVLGGESDEEESDGRGSRFKTERTNIISLKGVSSGKSLTDIPDSLDHVKTGLPNSGIRRGNSMQRGGKSNIRGRLGPIQRGGPMMRGGFGPLRRPQAPPPPGHKIHVNPHFRRGVHHAQPVWDNDRLPPPPGCESFAPPVPPLHHKDGNWIGPMPAFPPQHPGPPVQYQNTHMYPHPQQPQGCEEQYNSLTNTTHLNHPSRIVQFSESSQLITVENQHFQRPTFDPNCGTPNNQFPPHHNIPPHYNNNNNTFPNQFNVPQPRTNFQGPPQPFQLPNTPQNYPSYPPQEYPSSHPNPPPFQNFENNNWNSPPQMINNQQNHWANSHPHPQPQPPSGYYNPQPHLPPRPPFRQPMFGPPSNQEKRGMGMKRLVPRKPLNNSVIPAKQMRFEHGKQKTPAANIRSNLQEIKTVDNLPDTTTAQEPESEIEEDEETKQYRLKIAEQKALREKILKEKEARRLASIIEKQKKQENNINNITVSNIKPVVAQKIQPQHHPQHPQRQPQSGPGRGRGNPPSINRKPLQSQAPGAPVVQIQQMMGTMYKIVKVRTKEGAIVTRKTPLVMNSEGTVATPMKTVSSTALTQRRVVLPQSSTRSVGNVGRGVGGGNAVRMISARQTPQGRTLFTVQTTPSTPTRVVIDKRPMNPAMKVVATPSIPVSTLVTVENLSLSTSQLQIQKLAKQVGHLSSIKHEPELKRATLRFKNPKEAEQFFLKFHRKMIDLSRISVTVVPE